MKNKLYLVGLGPGSVEHMTHRAYEVIKASDVLAGYSVYIDQVRHMTQGKKLISRGMGQEKERCELAIEETLSGNKVAILCSGDASLYGLAGLSHEMILKKGLSDVIEVEVVPGITSALSCSSLLGAPIVEDFCTISLSDYMVSWDKIVQRIRLATEADFVIALYNPKSKSRVVHLEEAITRIRKIRDDHTPVGIVRNAYREDQSVWITTLGELEYNDIDMFCTLIVGNSNSYISNGRMITSRGYTL